MSANVEAAELAAIFLNLDAGARRVLYRMAKRVEAGQRTYGRLDLENDRRDFLDELRDELLDGLFYLAAEEERKETERVHPLQAKEEGWSR